MIHSIDPSLFTLSPRKTPPATCVQKISAENRSNNFLVGFDYRSEMDSSHYSFHIYVVNRIGEILELSNAHQWRYSSHRPKPSRRCQSCYRSHWILDRSKILKKGHPSSTTNPTANRPPRIWKTESTRWRIPKSAVQDLSAQHFECTMPSTNWPSILPTSRSWLVSLDLSSDSSATPERTNLTVISTN